MKNIVIISNFYNDNNNFRAYLAYKYFSEKKYNVRLITADFNHHTKKRVLNKKEYIEYIPVLKYSKNISIFRIFSHIQFAFKVKKKLKEDEIDLLYIACPPNILGYFFSKSKYKRILDITDLWPEAFPIPLKLKNILKYPFLLWKKLRDISIKNSDFILTHTWQFYKILKLNNLKKSSVIYLKKEKSNFIDINYENKKIKILYLGNISSIYDFESLIFLSKNLGAKLEIVGDGPYREKLIRKLESEKINYKYYGVIFDEKKKLEIIKECHFGYNGYKTTTEVSMSYKSIDYFSYGLPIINSANGDTWNLVEENKLGYNFQNKNIKEIVEKISKLNKKEYSQMNQNVKSVFKNYFSYESYQKEMDKILKRIERKNNIYIRGIVK